MASPDDRIVFRSRFNRVLAVLFVVVLAAVGVAVGITAQSAAATGLLVPAAFIVVAVHAVLWRPCVVVDDEGVTLVNVTRSVHVPWAALIDVDTKYALTLRTPARAYTAFAAPSPGGAGTLHARSLERRGGARGLPADVAGRARPGDLAGTDSGDAAYLVRSRWHELREAGRIDLGVAHETRPHVRWHVAQLAILVVLAAASVVALGWV